LRLKDDVVLELAGLHLLYGRQFGLRDVVLVHVEQDVLDHDDAHLLVTPGSVELDEKGIVVSTQYSFRNRPQ
jgi:hypothetical protein